MTHFLLSTFITCSLYSRLSFTFINCLSVTFSTTGWAVEHSDILGSFSTSFPNGFGTDWTSGGALYFHPSRVTAIAPGQAWRSSWQDVHEVGRVCVTVGRPSDTAAKGFPNSGVTVQNRTEERSKASGFRSDAHSLSEKTLHHWVGM